MKRQRTLLGALAALTLAIVPFIAVSPAQAVPPATVPTGCTLGGSGSYPADHVYYCAGATSSDAGLTSNALSLGSLEASELKSAFEPSPAVPGVPFYIFGTPAQYRTAIPAGASPDDNYSFGAVTFEAVTHRPLYVAIFKQDSESTPKSNPAIGNWSFFYGARAADALLGYMANGGVELTPYANMSATTAKFSDFNKQLAVDLTAFDLLSPCGSSGVFYEQQDPRLTTAAAPVYICSTPIGLPGGSGATLNAGYSGLNRTILQTIWPHAFGLGTPGYYAEISAFIQNAMDSSATPSKDHYLTIGATSFACSKSFLVSVNQQGVLPTTVPTGCPAMTTHTVCKKQFDNSSKFPGDGYIFNCVAPFDTTANTISSYEDRLNVSAQTVFRSGSTFQYVFLDMATYASTFTAAGVPLDSYSAGTAALTYAEPNVVYNVIAKTVGGSAIDLSQLTEIAVHELGHTFDYLKLWTTQSANASFNTAFLNDLLSLDYDVVGATQALSHPRNLCNLSGYVGPLVGINDPRTANASYPNGQPFCASGAFTAGDPFATNNPATGKPWLAHEVLRQGMITGFYWFSRQPSGTTFGYVNYPGGWLEWYAQSFHYVSFPDTGGSGGAQVPDGVVLNNLYLPCTAGAIANRNSFDGWLAQVYKGLAVALPTTCTTAVPAWFSALI
jgi:hypothetical protein